MSWQKLADNLELSLTLEDQEYAEEYIKYLIYSKKQLPKRLLYELQQSKRIDIAEILFFLYKKYLRYRTKIVKCQECNYINVVNNFFKVKCCNKKCKKMLGKIK